MTEAKSSQEFSLSGVPRFFREVRAEMRRISWPTAPDTRRMTLMVFILVSIVGLYLLTVDLIIGWSLSLFLGLGA